MNFYSTIWRFIIILLSFYMKRGPLFPAGCQRLITCGYLTVEPAPLFLLGSNLTVYCHNTKCPLRFNISLELNGETVNPWKHVNSTTMAFHLSNVRRPLSVVQCRLQSHLRPKIVGGLDLQGGLPPDKPENIICETSRSSDFIDCSWERGQETHLRTAYNISVSRANGNQILFDQTQDAEEITIPRKMIDKDTKYHLIITAYNHFGASQSDPIILCVKDIVIPETPRIMQIRFGNSTIAALLHWNTAESSEHLRSYVRLHTDNGSWEAGEVTVLSEHLIQVDGLKPLTEYEFQMRTCNSTSGKIHTSTSRSPTSKRSFCSKWSKSVRGRSPGKGPSQELHVWRMLGSQETNGLWMVTVLWKPPSPEDYSGEVQQYKIFLGNDQKQEMTCDAALSQYSVQVRAEASVSISAVTSYGISPPAHVPLRQSGDFGPVLRELAPSGNGSAVLVSWSRPGKRHWSPAGGEVLHYVLEWTSVPVAELQWQKLSKDQNSTYITGLAEGVRYNISLYAVTNKGVSAPSSGLVYAKEQEPESGPNLSVLVHETRQIWIQWDELPVDQQKGFITNYTIYLQTLDFSSTEQSESFLELALTTNRKPCGYMHTCNVTVSGSDPRQRWLDCPEGALALQVAASTSAGEGRRGNRISSQPAPPAAGLVFVIVFIITIFIGITANLMCWSCVRERIKKKCISLRPAWLDGNLPKPGNSIAIRLLEQDRSELNFSSTYSDPPLSPISLISQEVRDDVYPHVHMEVFQVGSGQATAQTPLLMEHSSYKPQIISLAPHEEEVMETEEDQRDVSTSGEEDRCVFGGLLGGFLSSVEVDFSDSPLGLTFSSVSSPLWPKPPETTSVLNGGVLLVRRGSENNVDMDSISPDSQQGEIMTCDTADACLSQHTVDKILTGGYFPQVAALCDTEK